MSLKQHAIIVAGGKGTRMNSALPKQFMDLNGKPVILHTLEAFIHYSPDITIVLVLPEADVPTWNSIASKHHFTFPVTIATGGTTRFQSVRNGLAKLGHDGLVAVHDGVRPLISDTIIAESFRLAAEGKSAVACVLPKDSLRVIDGSGSNAVDRSRYRVIQTPQTFDLSVLQRAYTQQEDPSFTDDASVVERAGFAITLFEGSYDNIKITTSEDFLVAEGLRRKSVP